jgi:uncharacterized protein (DUF1697 family)
MSSSTRYVALLRGINVGRAKRIAMADLRALVEELGFRDVRTLLNSGNVVFHGARVAPVKAAARIETAIEKQLGITSRVTVLDVDTLATVIAENPLGPVATDSSRLFVAVPREPSVLSALAPLRARQWGAERLAVGTQAAYLWCPDGSIDSPLSAEVARALRDHVTTRNWATTTKLHALASESSA